MIEMIQMICDVTHRIGCRIARSSRSSKELVFLQVCFLSLFVQFGKTGGKKVKGAGWLYRVERCLLRPTTLLNFCKGPHYFLFKSGSNLNLWPINLEMVCGSGCPDFGSLGLSINPLLFIVFFNL